MIGVTGLCRDCCREVIVAVIYGVFCRDRDKAHKSCSRGSGEFSPHIGADRDIGVDDRSELVVFPEPRAIDQIRSYSILSGSVCFVKPRR